MHRLIVVGSPRVNGRTALLADMLFNECFEECPDDGVSILSVASLSIKPCLGCDGCKKRVASDAEMDENSSIEDGDPLYPQSCVRESDAGSHQCVIKDDMAIVRTHMDACDELTVVVPVYFAGVPAQMKALLDRLQPYFWSDLRRKSKRPLIVHVVGEGNDPFGFQPLLTTVQSACSVAGFKLDTVYDWTGKIDASGQIVADADAYVLEPSKA